MKDGRVVSGVESLRCIVFRWHNSFRTRGDFRFFSLGLLLIPVNMRQIRELKVQQGYKNYPSEL